MAEPLENAYGGLIRSYNSQLHRSGLGIQ